MKTNTVVQSDAIRRILPHTCLTYREALESAFRKIARNEVVSSWMDAWEIQGTNPTIAQYAAVPDEGCLIDEKKSWLRTRSRCYRENLADGGNTGYYAFDWAWQLRDYSIK